MQRLGRRIEGLDLGPSPDACFVGGMRLGRSSRRSLGGFNATLPTVQLDLFPQGLRMHASQHAPDSVVPVWEASYAELAEVQLVGRISGWSTGLRFQVRGADQWVIFWTAQMDGVINALRAHGVSVSPVVQRFQFLNPGR
jgi:hypothetical protein